MADYLNRRVPTTAEINAGITKFNNFQAKNPGKTLRKMSPNLYGPAVGTAPAIGMPAAPVAPVAPAVTGQNGLRRPRMPDAEQRGVSDRLANAAGLVMAPTVLPIATGIDYLRRGAAYAAGGDVDSLSGGKNKFADQVKTVIFDDIDALRGDFAKSQADMRDMLGVKAAADPAAIDMKMVEEARRRRAAAAAATAAPAAAAAAAKPAVTAAPVAPAVQGDNLKGNYWIGGDGVRRDITWDANGNITSGLRDGNDPNVRKSRQANGAAILDNTQQLYTGLNRK